MPKPATTVLFFLLWLPNLMAELKELNDEDKPQNPMGGIPIPYPTILPKTQPCIFQKKSKGSMSGCWPHTGHTAELAATIGRTGTHVAKVLTRGANASVNCMQHATSTADGLQSCLEDDDNRCILVVRNDFAL